MSPPVETRAPRRFPRAAIVLITLTGLCCATAILFRTQIRSRFWAARIISPETPADSAACLTLLCNAGDSGRWGTETLLSHADPVIRQHGVIVLQHVNSPWSKRRLYDLLADADAGVVELAALGLALHGDDSVVPRLRESFDTGSADTARVACIALGRLATPSAVTALTDLARTPRDVARSAALVDALDDIGTPAAVPALLTLLADDRECPLPARRDLLAEDVLRNLSPAEASLGVFAGHADESESTATIAERAADALGRVTGIQQPHTSTMPADARAAARAAWQAWYDALPPANQGP